MCEISDIEARATFAGLQARLNKLAEIGKSPSGTDPRADAAFQKARSEYLLAELKSVFDARKPRPASKYFGQDLHCCPATMGAKPIHIEYVTWNDDGKTFADIIAIWDEGVRIPTVDAKGNDRFSPAQLNTWINTALEDSRFDPDAWDSPARCAVRGLAAYSTAQRAA